MSCTPSAIGICWRRCSPTRNDSLTWITSYSSIYHKPRVPLYDLFNAGKLGNDPRMYFN